MKRMKMTAAILVVMLLVAPVAVSAELIFADAPATHWASRDISTLAAKEVVNGFPDGTFRPSAFVTHAELAKIVALNFNVKFEEAKMYDYFVYEYGINKDNLFTLFSEATWYKPYAFLLNDFSGMTFAVTDQVDNDWNQPMKREEVVRLVANVLRPDFHKGNELKMYLPDDYYEELTAKFSDVGSLSQIDRENFYMAWKTGILIGYEDNTAQPAGNVTRAEVSAFVNRAFNYRNKIKEEFFDDRSRNAFVRQCYRLDDVTDIHTTVNGKKLTLGSGGTFNLYEDGSFHYHFPGVIFVGTYVNENGVITAKFNDEFRMPGSYDLNEGFKFNLVRTLGDTTTLKMRDETSNSLANKKMVRSSTGS